MAKLLKKKEKKKFDFMTNTHMTHTHITCGLETSITGILPEFSIEEMRQTKMKCKPKTFPCTFSVMA